MLTRVAVRASTSDALTNDHQLCSRGGLPLALTMKAVLVFTYLAVTDVAVPHTNATEKRFRAVAIFRINSS